LSIKAKDAADQADAMANLSQQNAGNAGTTSLGALLRAKLDTNEK
jgi:small subunit ribosomal protein S1